MKEKSTSNTDAHFKPIGTIAFLVLLLTLTAIIWFSVYNIQLERH